MLIWYHGNAGNIGDRLHNARWFVDRLGVDVVLVDYRGYGRSRGTPDEEGGLSRRAGHLRRGGGPFRACGGHRPCSAGPWAARVAIETALRRPAGALVLESVFRSVRALAREHYWFVPTAVIRTRMDNEAKIARVEVPTLVLHGDRDNIVPPAHGRRLFELAAPPRPLSRHRRRGAQRHLSRGGASPMPRRGERF